MIEIINSQKRFWISRKRFEALLVRLADRYGLKRDGTEIALAFVDNRRIRDLNNRFLKKDAPTDVLSFPVGKKGADGKYYLGDIIVSVPYAFRQCRPKEHGLERELEILTIHGFLHLMGFEHRKGLEEEEAEVRRRFLED